jgi:hypothetical protein
MTYNLEWKEQLINPSVKFLQLHMNYASLGAYTSLETMETMCIWYELEISTPTKFTKLVPSI